MAHSASSTTSPDLARRSPSEALANLRRMVLMDKVLVAILDAVPDFALVMDEQRQVVAANKALLETFALQEEEIVGKRPGELVCCLFSSEGPGGCGTGDHCTVCGTLRTIMESYEGGNRASHDCHVTLASGIPLDVRVTCAPVAVGRTNLMLCILKDISAEKRRSVLEKVFFHDVMNTIGSIRSVASALNQAEMIASEREPHYRKLLVNLAEKLADEIAHQRKLVAAEQGEFRPSIGLVSVKQLMRDVHQLYASHDIARDRHLELGEVADCSILSDYALIWRILGNMVKNALEETGAGRTVTMWCREESDMVTFSVHNDEAMPPEVQLQLFQRSFSTREGEGRGIGTYSMKLFGERFLKGKITFTSREGEGTTFSFTIPKSITGAERSEPG